MFCILRQRLIVPQKISRIRETVPKFLEMLGSDDSDFDGFGLGLVTSMVTSNMRGLKFEGAKLEALESLEHLAPGMTSEIILDRVLPYIKTMLKDNFPAVRIAALKTLTSCIREVKHVPSSDANVFPEYILPSIVPLCHDKNEMVRSALARHIAEVHAANLICPITI